MRHLYKQVTCPNPQCGKTVSIYESEFSGLGNREWEEVSCPYCREESIYREFTNKILST